MTTSGCPDHCTCCIGVTQRTPRRIENAPSLPAIRYRIGAHPDFVAGRTDREAVAAPDRSGDHGPRRHQARAGNGEDAVHRHAKVRAAPAPLPLRFVRQVIEQRRDAVAGEG